MKTSPKYIGIIPSRYASTRFPGKALADIRGKPMIQRVYEQASQALDIVFVATDDKRIFEAVRDFGGRTFMTSANHQSGTDRCAEAVQLAEKECHEKFDVVLNIQGDEPYIEPRQLHLLKESFKDPQTQIATLVKIADTADAVFDPNRPKVVIDPLGHCLYFSRSPIPFVRGKKKNAWFKSHEFYLHIGLYGYRKDVLLEITRLPRSLLELTESLEQLRWIENGFRISALVTTYDSFGIDTPEDLKRLLS